MRATRHHAALHEGQLEITGRFPDFAIRRTAWASASDADRAPSTELTPAANLAATGEATANAEAIPALCGLGFTRGDATRAVGHAMSQARPSGEPMPNLDALLRGALRALRPRA